MDRSNHDKSVRTRTRTSAGLGPHSVHREEPRLDQPSLAPRLYTRRQAIALLGLTKLQFLELERTGQLLPITVCGNQKFLSRDLELLLDTYRQVARRKAELDSSSQRTQSRRAVPYKDESK